MTTRDEETGAPPAASVGPEPAAAAARPATAVPEADRAPLARRRRNRMLVQAACLAITAFMAAPMYLITLAAFSSRAALNDFPKSFLPTDVSTDTMRSFLGATGVVPGFLNSLAVGLLTLVLSLAAGAPAGYALARHAFAGRDAYQLFLLFTRALPIVVLSVPLARFFITAGLSDTILAVALLHTALALPTTVLITASIFTAVPRDLEEAALVFGCTRFQAFRRVVAPLALPGIAAASVFTFVLSWNEVLGAAVLTLTNRTLPAQVLGSLQWSPLAFRFAGGFALLVPALAFIFVMRRYLLNMWGTTLR
jgi:multiple sugar transport system permease protein